MNITQHLKAIAKGLNIHIATTKVTPIDDDEFGFLDSVGGVFTYVKLTYTQLLAALKSYFDTVYPSISDISGMLTTENLLHVQDLKASGTNGGTFTSGSYQTRTLNTVVTNNIAGASLSANTITLPAGTYLCEGWGEAVGVGDNKAKLYNNSDSVGLLLGSNGRSSTSGSGSDKSRVGGLFTLGATKNILLQHRCTTTVTTTGFGIACSFADGEIYADLKIWKVG